MRKIKALVAAAVLCFAGSVAAQDVSTLACENCTASQMENLAIERGVGMHYIHSMERGVIVKYWVTEEDFGRGQHVRLAHLVQPEDWVLDQFALLHQFYLDNGRSLTASLRSSKARSTGGTINAYHVVGSSRDRNAVVNELHDNPRLVFTSVFASFGRAIKLANVVTPDPALTVKTMFPDGSHAYFRFNWDTKRWEYVPKSAVDSHGNSIPETADDFTNNGVGATYDFRGAGNERDVQDFLQRARGAGVRIEGGTGARRWACTVADNGVPKCIAY